MSKTLVVRMQEHAELHSDSRELMAEAIDLLLKAERATASLKAFLRAADVAERRMAEHVSFQKPARTEESVIVRSWARPGETCDMCHCANKGPEAYLTTAHNWVCSNCAEDLAQDAHLSDTNVSAETQQSRQADTY